MMILLLLIFHCHLLIRKELVTNAVLKPQPIHVNREDEDLPAARGGRIKNAGRSESGEVGANRRADTHV